jgi:hypothetical protein
MSVTVTSVIPSIIGSLTSPPKGRRITRIHLTYEGDKLVSAEYREDDEVLFTLTLTYDPLGNLTDITRTD